MKLPFIQHKGIGLHITDCVLRWVELSRIGDRIRMIASDTQKILKGDIEKALAELMQRQDPSYPFVTVNIGSQHVRQRTVDLPGFEDEEYLQHWLQEQIEQIIPEGLTKEHFVSRFHLMGAEEGKRKCVFFLVNKEAVEERKRLLETAGLYPQIITTGHLQAGYGFLFNENFVSNEVQMINIFEDGTSLHCYEQGINKNYFELSDANLTVAQILNESLTHFVSEGSDGNNHSPSVFYITGSEHFRDEIRAEISDLHIGQFNFGELLKGVKKSDKELPVNMTIAAGMAIKQLYPGLDDVNFLSEEETSSISNEISQKDTSFFGLTLGAGLLTLYLALMLAQYVLNSQLSKVQKQVNLLQQHITAISEAKNEISLLKARATQAQQQVKEGKTSIAQSMELLGRTAPGGVWLKNIQLTESKKFQEINIDGYAKSEVLIASYMEKLEQLEFSGDVRLIVSEQVTADQIYDKTEYDRIPLITFKLNVSMLPGKAGRE